MPNCITPPVEVIFSGSAVMKFYRHCEERSDEAIHWSRKARLDCFAVLAMTTFLVVDLDNDVAVFDMHRKCLGHVRPLGQRLAVFDDDRIGPYLDALRIEPGLAGAHIEFPAVPGAAPEFAYPRALIDSGLRRGQSRDASGLVERPAFARATIKQREELAVDMEHDNVAAIDIDHLVAAGPDLAGSSHGVTGPWIRACRARGRCR